MWAVFLILGIATGVLSGMGIGGGALLIPVLTIALGFGQHSAQNINLIYFIPTATIALISHVRNGRVEGKILWRILLPGIAAAIAGSMIAIWLDANILRRIFGGFLLIMGISELKKGWKKKDMEKNEFEKMKQVFINADTNEKVEIYVEARGLTQEQYKELLVHFPYGELYKLEEALV